MEKRKANLRKRSYRTGRILCPRLQKHLRGETGSAGSCPAAQYGSSVIHLLLTQKVWRGRQRIAYIKNKNIFLTKINQGQELISKVLLQSDFFCSTLVQWEVIHDIYVTERRGTDAQSMFSADWKTSGLYPRSGSCVSKAAKSSKAVKSSISVIAFLSASSSSTARSVCPGGWKHYFQM